MSADPGGYPPPRTTAAAPSAPVDPATVDPARDEAADVGQSAAQAGEQVASRAAEQASEVAAETGRQARNLVGEGVDQLREQARTGQHRAVDGLRTLADELGTMADKGGQPGLATSLAEEASRRAGDLAGWLERREPGDLVEEVRGFARRRPGVFLCGAALAGVLAGRLTRGTLAHLGGDGAQPQRPSPPPPGRTATYRTPVRPQYPAPQPVPGYQQYPPHQQYPGAYPPEAYPPYPPPGYQQYPPAPGYPAYPEQPVTPPAGIAPPGAPPGTREEPGDERWGPAPEGPLR